MPDTAGKVLAARLRAQRRLVSVLEPSPDQLTGSQAERYRRIQRARRTGDAVRPSGAKASIAGYPRYYSEFEA
ncbi:MAG TPA: hypothetical protein VGL97_02130 [Bryobacteraceae bacterium]